MKSTLFLAATAIIASISEEEPMKLVNTKNGFVVVEFEKGKALFHDRFLEAEMNDAGILIPPAMRDSFDGKKAIFPDDPLFQKAFVEVYYTLCIPNSTFQWEKS